MTATSHAAIGVALAVLIHNPIIGIPAALASHVLCDLTPHWDAGTNRKKKTAHRFFIESFADVLLSVIVTTFLLLVVFPNVIFFYGAAMAFSAQFLDWAAAPYFFFKIKFTPIRWVADFQKITNVRLDKPWGIVTQTSVVIFMLLLAKIIMH